MACLDAVQFALDVDVGAREGAPGRDRMTDVEAEVLYPALGAARGVLASIAPRTPRDGWEPACAEALSILRQATGRLRAWSPRCGRAPRAGASLPQR